MTTTESAPAPTTGRTRIDGIDLARGLAIIGMVMVHVAPPLAGDGGWYGISFGQASTLFALVAGVGITLSSRRGDVTANRARLVWRTVWLLPVGLGLSVLGTPVAVILQYYALWFLLAAPVLTWPSRRLATLTTVGMLVGPTVLVWAQVTNPGWYSSPGGDIGGRGVWFGEAGDVLLTGYYPTVSWVWIVYAGMLLARLDLRSDRVAGSLAGGGAIVAAATYGVAAVLRDTVDLGRWQPWLDTTGHSDTPLEMLATLGVATAVLGVCILIGRHARLLAAPGAALGRFALTVYVGQILVYWFTNELAGGRGVMFNDTAVGGLATTAWVTGVSIVVAMAWLAVLPRGPLEALDREGHQRLVLPLLRTVRSAPPARRS